ncbi:hypothetical protein AZE42_00938 [Rhizopogon vesiculosus]|uniref:Uncharacterized protein n=1 Tax=Rhizopogon vesiculosus TaxID=180088 RepID=A0A1J8QPD6_9AGAM|nr:hypothetical protein AZE42_00938 [Rhizopogon vesiculosus]
MLPRLSSSNRTFSIIKRHISKATSKNDARMRALVSLYHQCDSFITPENLSQKIDEAFVPQTNNVSVTSNFDKRSYAELRRLVVEREEEPRHFFTKASKPSTTSLKVALSSSSPNNGDQRTARAMEALVGMDKDGRPLWGGVKREAGRINEQLKEDRRQGM